MHLGFLTICIMPCQDMTSSAVCHLLFITTCESCRLFASWRDFAATAKKKPARPTFLSVPFLFLGFLLTHCSQSVTCAGPLPAARSSWSLQRRSRWQRSGPARSALPQASSVLGPPGAPTSAICSFADGVLVSHCSQCP